ncbi:hypothetical protein MSAN_02227700 [Mycena sanguinolenta]|uniref:Uncharacterized protein n=1 Tax=Mycena sanguinolenta TaxID=230812 RepID=A0A8H6XB75_9AGAR|nr:hypothetical protein MSAN_02227700 [Mycena sanguinolenta]
MSPVPQRNDPAMFSVSYFYPAASPSTSDSPDPSASTLASISSTTNPSSSQTFEASTIIVGLSFLLFVLWTVAIFLFAPDCRQKFLEWRAKKREAKKKIQGLGFGYDGLTRAEFQQFRKQEEHEATRYPPSLDAIPLLPPIMIPGPDASEAASALKSNAEVESEQDPAPVYERGDYRAPEDEEDVSNMKL